MIEIDPNSPAVRLYGAWLNASGKSVIFNLMHDLAATERLGIEHERLVQERLTAVVAERDAAIAEKDQLRKEAFALAAHQCEAPYSRENGDIGCSAQDKLRSNIVTLTDERDRLRKALIECGRIVGCFLHDEVSTDFLMGVPNEIRAALTPEAKS